MFLERNKIKNAIKVFELNTNENPKSANSFDSLAEAYFIDNQLLLSKSNYKKSLALDAQNNNAKKMIKTIEDRMND